MPQRVPTFKSHVSEATLTSEQQAIRACLNAAEKHGLRREAERARIYLERLETFRAQDHQ